jgi:hypothetical protein
MKTFVIDAGNVVLCDLCSEDYTDSNKEGGFIFQSKAVCPDCEHSFMNDIKKYNEEHLIRAKALKGQKFKDFVIEMR